MFDQLYAEKDSQKYSSREKLSRIEFAKTEFL